jgi:ABC-type transport system involved in multi-copper enzyme maturation permease subunit
MYIYFASLLVGYILLMFVQSSNLVNNVLQQGGIVFDLMLIFGGGFLFATIYNDDLTAKSLPQLIGFGKKRTTIVISKIIISIILSVIVYFAAYAAFYLLVTSFGVSIDADTNKKLLLFLFNSLFKLFAYYSIGSIAAYGTQKATVSVVVFTVFATGLGEQMIMLLFAQFQNIIDLTGCAVLLIVGKLVENPSIETITPYIITLLILTVISIIAFRKKDLKKKKKKYE